jgi:hypothetical protein
MMGGVCNEHGRYEEETQTSDWKTGKEKANFKYLDVDGKIIFKRVLKRSW